MGLLEGGDDSDRDPVERRQRMQEDSARQQAADKAAVTQATEMTKEVAANPRFLSELRDPDIDSDLVPLDDELGAETSGAHVVGNRDEDYPRRLELLMQNAAERVISERNPQAPYREKPYLLALAQGVHRREDTSLKKPVTSEEQRHIRSAFEALTSYQALAAENRGLRSVTEATAVTRRETDEESTAGKAATFFE